MAAYSNYQMPQFAQPPAQPYGQQPPPQYSQGVPQQQQQFFPNGSTAVPTRMTPRRSLSMGSAQAAQNQMALVSFDPYASTTNTPTAAPPQPAYNNYGAPPPSFTQEDMTTAPLAPSQFDFQQYNTNPPGASAVSDISMFTSGPPAPPTATAPPAITDLVAQGAGDNSFSEASVDPALIAEQERIWQEIQDRRKMELIRADGGVANARAIIPHRAGNSHGSSRQAPPRTRSMPNPKGQQQSLARGGVAVLDPKKDQRKQTRKMKTAGGAVGGAVMGGLILGPVGVVLGAGGGAAVSNKMAKSRDKRKQQEFEQRNFQKGASASVAAKGEGSFV